MAHVLILYNEPVLPPGHPEQESEAEVLLTVQAVDETLASAGHRVSRLGIGRDPEGVAAALRRTGADVVFNLFEGIPDHPESETAITSLLEWLALPFTGCPARALSLARDKPLAKRLLQGSGLPTPAFLELQEGDDLPGEHALALHWPLFVKPADRDASVGVEQTSVVTNLAGLYGQVESLRRRLGGRVLVEEYVAGRELTVAVVEGPASAWEGIAGRKKGVEVRGSRAGVRRLALPVSEFEFESGGDRWPIVTYDAKWSADSLDAARTSYRVLAELPADQAATLQALALRAFAALGLRDCGRIDFRVDRRGRPFILEANPNPDLNRYDCVASAAEEVGLGYRDLLNGLVELALSRKAP